ncbi:MAG: cation:proton antiporter, partial [Gammaproteobacteria bacterium]
MGFDWVAIGLDEVTWIALAFVLGLASRSIGLPPLVGFLAAGFFLNSQGATENELIPVLADLGITLLLFTVGLKLNLRTLARPQVWAVSGIHMSLTVGILGCVLFVVSLLGVWLFAELSLATAFL